MNDEARTPELTLRGLRIFVALEETGSVIGAAARIGGSASGVSQTISALEQAVGARLFDRKAKPVTLTPAGQLLRRHAHRILSVVSEAQTELAEISLAALPQLNLAIIDDLDA
jgi:DNA-binding transcriptional LysR family regulator